jgi:putative endonuclease
MFYVYILHSKSLQIYYKGFSADFSKRLEYHNSGKSTYTSKTADWELVYVKAFEIKKEALIEEKRLKKLNKTSLERLINNYLNKQ